MALIGGFLTKHSHGKLCIVQTTAAILVIGVEERAKLLLREVHATLFKDSLKLGKINGTRIHDVEVLEHLHEASLFRQLRIRLLNEFIFESFLKPKKTK